jgi:hypothetical protein
VGFCPPHSDNLGRRTEERPGSRCDWKRRTRFCTGTALGGTLGVVLNAQLRFFYGYRPAVPVV